jgi:ABC-type transport system substrate-binding protein
VIEGRVDLVTSLIPKDTLKVAASSHSKVVKGREGVTFTDGWFNLMSPHTGPLRDMRVRKALNYAVNREDLIRYGFKGNALAMRGYLNEKSGLDVSNTKAYEWNIPKARELLKDAGFGEGFKMKLFYDEKDYLIAQFLKRFYSMLKVEVEITPFKFDWIVRHVVYPNTREGYDWEEEDWWMILLSEAADVPEVMFLRLEGLYNSKAPARTVPDWLLMPLEEMYQELLRTTDRKKRYEIYKKANEYIADQALAAFTVAPISLYGVNRELNFIPPSSQYLYLDYSSVTDNHWSIIRAEE